MEASSPILVCKSCKTTIHVRVKFCSKCGNRFTHDDEEHSQYITKSLLFYLIFIAYIVFYYLAAPNFSTLSSELLLEGIFAIIILIFCFIDFKNILNLFKNPRVKVQVYAFVIIFPIISSLVVSFSMDQINTWLFDGVSENLYLEYIDFDNPIIWSFVFVSFVPAVFEELGFRGYLFNQLTNITSPKVTILLTSFLFALMHFSLISIIWIFPFGLVLGYLRYRYKVIWLGMIVHFLHNSIVLMLDMNYFN